MAFPTGELYVDLRAVADNWNVMRAQVADGVQCGAVVKANAYGLGVERIAPKLYSEGCRHFFVSTLKEGMQLHSLVGPDAKIYVLTGCAMGPNLSFLMSVLFPSLCRWKCLSVG